MSAALVRQALDFVDPDESKSSGKKKRGSRSRGAVGQEPELHNVTKSNNKNKTKKRNAEEDSDGTQEVISKLLKLSKTTVNKGISQEIVKRAVSGKPIFDKIEIKEDVEKSILFPDDDPPKKTRNKKRNFL